ncbi:MAG: C25 family cysteine peptidase [Planctomycetota bacterium]|nr:C25 family cysteine peptidase [Planctomycetota bacterium]
MFSEKAGRIVPWVAVATAVLVATFLALEDSGRLGDGGKPAGVARMPSDEARLQVPVAEAGGGATAGGEAEAAVKEVKAEVWRMVRADGTGGQSGQGDASGGWRRVEAEVKLASAELPKAPVAQAGTVVKATAHGAGFVSIAHAYPGFEIVGGRGGGWSGFKPPRKMHLSSDPGMPVLPVAPVQLLLPPREDIVEIVVVPGRQIELPGTYQIEPAGTPVPIGKPEDARPPEPDPKVYGSDAPYPGNLASVLGTQYKMGHGIAVLTLNPVQYRPKSGKVLVYESLSVVIRTKVPNVPATRILPRKEDAGEVGKVIDNPEVLERYGAAIDGGQFGSFQPLGSLVNPADSYPYVIITTNALKNAATDYKLQDVITLRNSEGLAGTIVTTEDIYANYTGVDNPEKIRNFIIDARNGWETQYVLIVGDTGVVAYRSLWGDAGSYSRNIPSDLYYGCLDGNYNNDGDGTWGESNDGPGGGLPDFMYEVYVGRASVENETEMSNFVYKTLTYEATDELDAYRYRAIMAGETLDSYTQGDWSMENLIVGKYGSVGLAAYVTPYRLYDYEKDDQGPGAWNKSHLIALINSNKYSMIHHLGHSNTGYNMKMGNGDADALTNTKFFVAYSQGCYPGDLPSDCIAEHFTTSTRKGAVAGVWNSVYGWYNPGSDDGLSQKFHREFVDAVFGHNKYQAAKANAHSKEAWISSMSSGYMRWIAYAENLFGDPALKLPNYTTLPMPCIDSTTVADNVVGNNDGIINAGETVDLEIKLKNNGQSGTSGVTAVLSSSSAYVTIVTSSASFGNLPAGAAATGTPKYRFSVSGSCPTNTALPFTLTITDSASRTWVREFTLYCYTSCTISGKVTDQGTGAGILGATVSYTGPRSGSVSTAADGSYTIDKLIDGTYSLTASHPSYQSKSVTGQVVPPSKVINFALVYPNIVVPATLTAICAPGASTTAPLTVQNTGTATLLYGVFQAGSNQGRKIATLPAATGYSQMNGLTWAPNGLWRTVYNSSASKYQFIRQDVSSGAVLQVLDIPSGMTGTPYGLAWDGTYLWIGTSAPRVYRVNPADGTIAANFAVMAAPYDMAWDGSSLWIICYYGSAYTVAKYNTSGSMLFSFALSATTALTLDWDGSALWVGTYSNPAKYAAYDTSGNKLYEFSSSEAPHPYYGLAWDGSHFWVSSYSDPKDGFRQGLVARAVLEARVRQRQLFCQHYVHLRRGRPFRRHLHDDAQGGIQRHRDAAAQYSGHLHGRIRTQYAADHIGHSEPGH